MISLQGLASFVLLPVNIILAIIRYFLGVTQYRKFKNRLNICVKLTIYKFALSLSPDDAKYLDLISNSKLFLIMKRLASDIIKDFPHYGERYGEDGIWIKKEEDLKKTNPVIIYAHGGGYFLQTQIEQLSSLFSMIKLLDKKIADKTSFLFLDYDLLSPNHKLPRQVHQLDNVYSQLVKDGYSNIILMGDSAGGHLDITYTEYIRYNKPPGYPLPSQLLLLSPWVNMMPTEKNFAPGTSYFENHKYDMINKALFKYPNMINTFYEMDEIKRDPYLHWGIGYTTDWKKNPFFSNPKSKVLLLCGEDESFRDCIISWSKEALGIDKTDVKFGNSNNELSPLNETKLTNNKDKCQTQWFIEPWGIHDAFFFVEYDVLSQVKKGVTADKLDKEKYFNTTRIVNYLNENL